MSRDTHNWHFGTLRTYCYQVEVEEHLQLTCIKVDKSSDITFNSQFNRFGI